MSFVYAIVNQSTGRKKAKCTHCIFANLKKSLTIDSELQWKPEWHLTIEASPWYTQSKNIYIIFLYMIWERTGSKLTVSEETDGYCSRYGNYCCIYLTLEQNNFPLSTLKMFHSLSVHSNLNILDPQPDWKTRLIISIKQTSHTTSIIQPSYLTPPVYPVARLDVLTQKCM